jgi:small subunit ribosomal protein S11
MAQEAKEKQEPKEEKAKKKADDEGGAAKKKKEASASAAEGGAAPAKAGAEGGAPAPAVKKKKKGRKQVPVGIAHVQSTFNNTIITFSDVNGNTVSWASAGSTGFKGSRKSTPFAAQIAAEVAAGKARDAGMRSITLFLKGPGSGRESAVRSIQKSGIRITAIRDVTPIPHNGCKPPKKRRV